MNMFHVPNILIEIMQSDLHLMIVCDFNTVGVRFIMPVFFLGEIVMMNQYVMDLFKAQFITLIKYVCNKKDWLAFMLS